MHAGPDVITSLVRSDTARRRALLCDIGDATSGTPPPCAESSTAGSGCYTRAGLDLLLHPIGWSVHVPAPAGCRA